MIMVHLMYLDALPSQIEKEIGPFLKQKTSGRVIDMRSKILHH